MRYSEHEQRELDAKEPELGSGSTHPWIGAIMIIGDRPCAGGECDEASTCRRHRLAPAVAYRIERMRGPRKQSGR